MISRGEDQLDVAFGTLIEKFNIRQLLRLFIVEISFILAKGYIISAQSDSPTTSQ
jgi:hypothetical protein